MVLQFVSKRVFPERPLNKISAVPARTSSSALPNASRIMNGVYIGDFQLALKVLQSYEHMGVTHVLSVVSSSILSSMCNSCVDGPGFILSCNAQPSSIHFQTEKRGSRLLRMVVPLMDTPEEDILQVLQPCFKFIDEGRGHGIVFVHCISGRSRSAAVVSAYLMRTLRLSLKQAMEMVNRHYKKASPNAGYMRQLEHFDMLQKKSLEDVHDGMSVIQVNEDMS